MIWLDMMTKKIRNKNERIKNMSEIFIYAQEGTYQMSNNQLKKDTHGNGKVGVLYGFNNYVRSVDAVKQLVDEIKKDFPDIQEKNMEVWCIKNTQSRMHAEHTMVWVMIPVEKFIALRDEGILNIL